MSRPKSDRDHNGVPNWQSNKMRALIAERWSEIWQIVEAREKAKD